jgi:hypothetical protein
MKRMQGAKAWGGVIVGLAAISTARADIPVELVGQWGGPSTAVAVSGNRVYLGVGPRLVVLDVTQPAGPTVLGQTEVLPGPIRAVAVAGDYAYVMAGAGLQIIDVSNPAAPLRVREDAAAYGEGVAVAGNYAYVADGSSLYIFDVSNPAAPEWVDSLGVVQPYDYNVVNNAVRYGY